MKLGHTKLGWKQLDLIRNFTEQYYFSINIFYPF